MLRTGLKISEQAAFTIQKAQELIEPLVVAVENASPGHNFGRRAVVHGEDVASLSNAGWGPQRLTERQIEILHLARLFHDYGRVIVQAGPDVIKKYVFEDTTDKEVLFEGQRAAQHRHGELSANFFKVHSEILRNYPQDDQELLWNLLHYHATAEVPNNLGAEFETLVYLIRDSDKVTILRDLNYFNVEGALKQFSMWGIQDPDLATQILAELKTILSDDKQNTIIAEWLSSVLSGKSTTPLPNTSTDTSLEREFVFSSLNQWFLDPISEKGLQRFQAKEQMQKANNEITSSYAPYMLAGICMLFDMRSPSAFRIISEERLLDSRLTYLRSVSPEAYEKIVAPGLTAFFKEKDIPFSLPN